MNPEYYLEHIDFQATTKLDFTTLFRDPKVFRALILDLIKPFRHDDFNKIACPESLGFVLGSAAATELRKGLILIRKSGKLPNIQSNIARQTFTDYTDAKNSFEVNKALIEPGDRVLVIDDWVETGGQMKGLTRLLTRRGATIAGISVIGFNKINRTQGLQRRYKLRALIDYSAPKARDLTRRLDL